MSRNSGRWRPRSIESLWNINFTMALKSGAITAHIPRILGYDAQNHLLMLEDLGQCEDMTSVYGLREINAEQVETLVSILAMIHRTKAPKNFPDNIACGN